VIIRTYQCDECGLQFEVALDSGTDADPDCPDCSKILNWVPGMFALKTDKSRAVDLTQRVMEQDYGLTNFNDNSREGDVAFKPPPEMQTAEREDIEQAVREYVRETTQVPASVAGAKPQAEAAPAPSNFWGAQPTGGVQTQPIPAAMMLAGAKTGPQGPNPMEMLQQGIKSGQLASKAHIISRWRP
jgi:hypothetical protein